MILASKGSIQPGVASQCESKKIKTSPVACSAPAKRDLINPERLTLRMTETLDDNCLTCSSSGSFKSSKEIKIHTEVLLKINLPY